MVASADIEMKTVMDAVEANDDVEPKWVAGLRTLSILD